MVKRSLSLVVVLLFAAACGSTPASTPQGPTAASVSVQQSDLPSGLVKCEMSGDINAYLAKTKTSDPTTYASIKKSWDDAQKNGATAANINFYTDNASHCAALQSSSADVSSANYKLVVNFVIQFKDAASAAKGYTSESIFDFSAAALKNSGAPAIDGAATGLSPNSVVLSIAIANTSYYVAVWQNKAFMVILAVLNIDTGTAKKIALAENGRIK